MLDFTQSHISLAAAALAFGNPEPGLYAWLLPVLVTAGSWRGDSAAGRRDSLPAVIKLSGFGSAIVSAVIGDQLGVLEDSPERSKLLATPGVNICNIPPSGWAKVEPLLFSFRYLRERPLDVLPAYPRAVFNSVRGRPLWQGECKPLAEMLPRAAGKSYKVQREMYYLLVVVKSGEKKLDARKRITLNERMRGRVDGWLDKELGEMGLELGFAARRELMPLQQALALGEGVAMLPKKPLPAHLRDVIQLPGKTLEEGMGALAKQIKTSLRDAAEIDGQMFYDDEPDDGFDG